MKRKTKISIPVPLEHPEQCAVIDWCDWNTKKYPCLAWIYAVPNGARTSISVAKRLKKEGMRAGVPDLFLPFPKLKLGDRKPDGWCDHVYYHGLFIEMKRKKGSVTSPEQKAWHKYLLSAGYQVVIAKGADEAVKFIKEYLE